MKDSGPSADDDDHVSPTPVRTASGGYIPEVADGNDLQENRRVSPSLRDVAGAVPAPLWLGIV